MINETISHDEFAVFRATTGGAYNFPFAYGVIAKGTPFPVKGSIPVATQHYGNIKSTGKQVLGIGTKFELLNPGDYLYHKDVVRQIDYIIAPVAGATYQLLYLTEAFPSDITIGETPLVCHRQTFKKVQAFNTSASTAAILQEAPLKPAEDRLISGGAPISYDATAGEISFTVHS
jgi:hypothetical protein